jgi:type VI secretion system protein ImpG
MDPRLLRYYTRELQHIREMGGEFAKEFPKIAGRLGLEGFECADPYVERLLEGFGFLAARVQLKLDAEFPRFTQHLLEMVYPHYLSPLPSMAVVQLEPDLTEGSLAAGFEVPRETTLLSLLGKGEQTACEYRTAHDVTLLPIELVEAEYFTHTRDLAELDIPPSWDIKAGIRLRLRATAGLTFDKIALDKLQLYLRGSEELPMHLYEQFQANRIGVVARSTARPASWHQVLAGATVRGMGFEDHEALLPHGARSFSGYRLLQEYFAFPGRYMFVELGGLGPAVRRCTESELDVMVLLNQSDHLLENSISTSNFALFCCPAINLFPRRTDRIHLSDRQSEYHVVPDKTRPMDFEVFEVTGVVGHGTSADVEREFRPFYYRDDLTRHDEDMSFYTLHRVPRLLSSKQRKVGPRSSYVGSEVFISLVDANEAPHHPDLRQLALTTLCTNRDLPLQMPVGKGRADFTVESGAPVKAVRVVAGPTAPQPSSAGGSQVAWQLINHLSLNYLSLVDIDSRDGAAALRQMLALYGDASEAPVRRQIEGVRSIASRPITRRLPGPGPMAFGRGLEIMLTCEERAFEGTGVFLLGAVLERFFARFVSINSFTETILNTLERGEVMRWPARAGLRHSL